MPPRNYERRELSSLTHVFACMDDPRMLRHKVRELEKAAEATENADERFSLLRYAAQLEVLAREQEQDELISARRPT